MTLQDEIATCRSAFRNRYDVQPIWAAAAPGRVNLIGEHVDYNDGVVLPMAIDRYTVIAAADNGSQTCRFFSNQSLEQIEVDLASGLTPGRNDWGAYLAGVLHGFHERGIEIAGFDAMIQSSVPVGSGLSSSAALEVAAATVLEGVTGHRLMKPEKALLCQSAEHEFARVPCGIMDQYASVFGAAEHLVRIDCLTKQVDLVPWPSDDVVVLIANSHAPHRLKDGEYALRRKQSRDALLKLGLRTYRELDLDSLMARSEELSELEFRRAKHVVTETKRVLDCAIAIANCEWEVAGELFYNSHTSLRDDYSVSCEELDALVQIAKKIGVCGGVFGSRMTGGGFGGCTVSLVNAAMVPTVKSIIERDYEARVGIMPTVFATKPGRGAFLI